MSQPTTLSDLSEFFISFLSITVLINKEIMLKKKKKRLRKKNEKEDLGYIIKISDLPFSLYLVKVGVGFQFYKPKLA